jgi:hypothetical protein
MTNTEAIEQGLNDLAEVLDRIALTLGSQDATLVESGAIELRNAVIRFEQFRRPGQKWPRVTELRIKLIGEKIAILREALIRLSAQTGRAVVAVLPSQAQDGTYDTRLSGSTASGRRSIYKN